MTEAQPIIDRNIEERDAYRGALQDCLDMTHEVSDHYLRDYIQKRITDALKVPS